MKAKDLRHPLLETIGQKSTSDDLPVARVRSDSTVGRIVMPADAKNRIVLDVDGIRRVVHVGKLDLLCPGKVIVVEGERGVVTAVRVRGAQIEVEALYGTVTMSCAAKDIDGMPR